MISGGGLLIEKEKNSFDHLTEISMTTGLAKTGTSRFQSGNDASTAAWPHKFAKNAYELARRDQRAGCLEVGTDGMV